MPQFTPKQREEFAFDASSYLEANLVRLINAAISGNARVNPDTKKLEFYNSFLDRWFELGMIGAEGAVAPFSPDQVGTET